MQKKRASSARVVRKVLAKGAELSKHPGFNDTAYPRRWHASFYVLKSLTERLQHSARDHVQRMKEPVLVDMGCGSMPYRAIFEPYVSEYVGADIEGNRKAKIQIAADYSVPMRDECVDIVLSTQVLEHVASV